MSAATSDADGSPEEQPPVNRVHLRGRMSGEPQQVDLPSGDTLVSFRLVVPRVPPAKKSVATDRQRRVPTIDTIDCVVKTGALRRRVLAAARDAGAEVEVAGALRRRFYRSPGGLNSRYEVELTSLTRCPTVSSA